MSGKPSPEVQFIAMNLHAEQWWLRLPHSSLDMTSWRDSENDEPDGGSAVTKYDGWIDEEDEAGRSNLMLHSYTEQLAMCALP
jgi:hypothetical protein